VGCVSINEAPHLSPAVQVSTCPGFPVPEPSQGSRGKQAAHRTGESQAKILEISSHPTSAPTHLPAVTKRSQFSIRAPPHPPLHSLPRPSCTEVFWQIQLGQAHRTPRSSITQLLECTGPTRLSLASYRYGPGLLLTPLGCLLSQWNSSVITSTCCSTGQASLEGEVRPQ
jgi:hypothetical protein